MAKLGDYDRWFKSCEKCGLDSGKKTANCKNTCWKCGNRLHRDYSERALKENKNEQG